MNGTVNGTNHSAKKRPGAGGQCADWKLLKGEAREAAIKGLPAGLLETGDFNGAVALLTDLEFLEEKIAAGLISELISDLERKRK